MWSILLFPMHYNGLMDIYFLMRNCCRDVVKELERSYNVKIQIASDTLNTFRFYGNFVHREQNIQEVLEALSATRKIHYIIEGHNITLY